MMHVVKFPTQVRSIRLMRQQLELPEPVARPARRVIVPVALQEHPQRLLLLLVRRGGVPDEDEYLPRETPHVARRRQHLLLQLADVLDCVAERGF